ncbi:MULTISPECIES: NAD(P)-dependent alcohol dehydrogenase [unclassified Algoriphagus]|jgi:NADPH:quinone reductase-like Zn-dependent oxidoreductase|uniref:NAD(P)-dependent alcohol dehydrogenase n=5 Tax=Algoriphagus TaxID=246875 RepID=UPI000C9633E0|nr:MULTISPECIES: NAD(P)-dependent alcohol dehydrogenase [unclassified Algoriphagus]MAN88137.1 NAD(P)-dependent alcohol dehydrogenase [Algoriphagus sp.]QYH37472.1 NAD(P)-dependent alcohol dehydrogenase [Algoriphagus sp. NBT04N3]HAH37064.1 NAD(P)-dependent alcohol dehydrogenase [Algoriphagus sp.]HCH44839.1 NAD(P)-dependent alcohol dehydrogenase [Algoriphagus sp.]|tara:strand:+ start:1663 stop:2643 length:981 start_codon:yes stop_codon:yes gene_type:complete
MKAAVRYEYCSPSELKIAELPEPEPQPKEIQVKVMTCTVNRTDMAVLTGWPWIMRLFVGYPKPKRATPGTDFVGEITQIGSEVKEYAVGDRVWGFIDNGCGSHGEYFCTSSFENLRKVSKNIDQIQAGASIEGVHYAYNFLNKINLKEGDQVLVIGGTGAIGSAAIQILKSRNIHVTAVSLGNVEKVAQLGADQVIDGLLDDFTGIKQQFDAVLDAVGKSRFKICKPLLKKNGTYLSSELGHNWENPFLSLSTSFFSSKKVKFPIPLNVNKSLIQIEELLLEDKFKPLIDRVVSLEQLPEAYTYVGSGKKLGNVILSYLNKDFGLQ